MPDASLPALPQCLTVDLGPRSYEVWVGPGLLDELGERAAALFQGRQRAALITDSHVAPLYASTALASLRLAGIEAALITVPAGEASKSLDSAEAVLSDMARAGLDRKSFVIALGGGVIGDLAGFCAAIYQRGIPYIQMPTTILSQVDSSVGGKTGVNLPEAKNMVGAFHQPALVLADTRTLDTLAKNEWNEGFAEIIKHAAIRDAAMFPLIEAVAKGQGDLAELIRRNIAIKASIVEQDEFETKGLRALLNFGHTLGHAIEAAAGYGGYLHGEAIALGLRAAARLSVSHSSLTAHDASQIESALAAFRLPLVLPDEPRFASIELIKIARSDKKYDQGSIRFVLLRSLGDAFVSHDVTEPDLRVVLDLIRNPCSAADA
jgi:3-dehydroquinate synthase